MIAVPRKTTTYCCKVQKVAIVHETGEKGCSGMIENLASLITRKNGFIKTPNQNPGDGYGAVEINEVVPKGGSHGGIRASVYTGAGSCCISKADCEGYGILVGSSNEGSSVVCYVLEEPHAS